MITIDNFSDLKQLDAPLHLAMGVFDGVHRGHQAVIGEVLEGARESGGLAGVLTFEPHPVSVMAPDHAPKRILASVEHKKRVLSALGVKVLVLVRFDETFAGKEPEEFIEELVTSCADLRQLAVGEAWRFGKGRRGDVDLLRSLAGALSVQVDGVPHIHEGEERISSTRIRQAIRAGDFAAAKEMLGREYRVLGTVQRGRRLGREIGFPTANLSVHNEELPPAGVYAVTASVDGVEHPAVANLGTRPTVEGTHGRPLLEVHVFDFDGDLYDREIEVRFDRFLREERKFAGLEELQEQIGKDAEEARSFHGA